jgi:hypothetical protein
MAAPDRANNPSRIIFDDIKGAKTGLFGDPVKEVLRWNPVVQSPAQQAYVDARQNDSKPLRGEQVTIKGVNDDWRTKPVVARGFDSTGESQRYNPKTAMSPTNSAYREAKWAAGADKPLRGESVTIKGVNDDWRNKPVVARGFGGTGSAPVQINSAPTPTAPKAPSRVSTFLNGIKNSVGKGGGGFGGGGLPGSNFGIPKFD